MLGKNDFSKFVTEELQKYVPLLEGCFRDMVDMQFTVENGKVYILGARRGKRLPLANLRIIISMLCEGIINLDEVIQKIPYKGIQDLVNETILVNPDKLTCFTSGIPGYLGVGIGIAAFSHKEAELFIDNNEPFIYCRPGVQREDIDVIKTKNCTGVITLYGGMTSHAALICRGFKLPCILGCGNLDLKKLKSDIRPHNNYVTIDGSSGKIYAGICETKKNIGLPEIEFLYKLLPLIVKYNGIDTQDSPLLWRLWDVLFGGRVYSGVNNNAKRLVSEKSSYKSFIQPSKEEISKIKSKLTFLENSHFIVEDIIGFLFSQLSSQVSTGKHYLYMRPLLDPMKTMKIERDMCNNSNVSCGTQLTGIEFFNINQFVDFLIDIYSIKIYFNTNFRYQGKSADFYDKYFPLNYLDYTNPLGESLIINTHKAIGISIYINDVLIPIDNLATVYHLIRRRAYHWSWYDANNVTRNEIIDYLKSERYLNDSHSKLCSLCEEMYLIENMTLTHVGLSLLGRL